MCVCLKGSSRVPFPRVVLCFCKRFQLKELSSWGVKAPHPSLFPKHPPCHAVANESFHCVTATETPQPGEPAGSLQEEEEAASGLRILRPHGAPRAGQAPLGVSDLSRTDSFQQRRQGVSTGACCCSAVSRGISLRTGEVSQCGAQDSGCYCGSAATCKRIAPALLTQVTGAPSLSIWVHFGWLGSSSPQC